MRFEKTMLRGSVEGVYISKYPDRAYNGDDYVLTQAAQGLTLTPEGIRGERHFGYTMISGGRFKTLYQKGTTVKNNRQWSAISLEEVAVLDANLGLEGRLTPELLGMNLLIDGIPHLSELRPMTYLILSPHNGNFKAGREEDVALVVYGQALPCSIAGKALDHAFGTTDFERRFPSEAMDQCRKAAFRGTTGWVEKGGVVRPGYTVWALIPTGQD